MGNRSTEIGRSLVLLFLAAGCGAGDDEGNGGSAGSSYGGRALATLSETCEDVSGLTGQSVLDQKFEQLAAELGYVTAKGEKVSPTQVTIDLVWPASPVATCYPAYSSTAVSTGPRVGIAGIEMHFSTADGKFDEQLDAIGWVGVMNGALTPPVVTAVTAREALHGTWQPFPDYGSSGSTLAFVSRLSGAASAQAGGNVSMTAGSIAELEAGIFRSSFAMAIWPLPGAGVP